MVLPEVVWLEAKLIRLLSANASLPAVDGYDLLRLIFA